MKNNELKEVIDIAICICRLKRAATNALQHFHHYERL